MVGIDGNGQRELEEALAGVRRPSAGEVLVDRARACRSRRARCGGPASRISRAIASARAWCAA